MTFNRETGEERAYALADHYGEIASISLSSAVPEDVRNSFATAQNVALYAWFAYALVPTAILHALSTLELALKHRMDVAPARGLKERFDAAIARGWIKSEQLVDAMRPYMIPPTGDDDELVWGSAQVQWEASFARRVGESLADIRNSFAHGSYSLLPHPYFELHLVVEVINQLYAEKEGV